MSVSTTPKTIADHKRKTLDLILDLLGDDLSHPAQVYVNELYDKAVESDPSMYLSHPAHMALSIVAGFARAAVEKIASKEIEVVLALPN